MVQVLCDHVDVVPLGILLFLLQYYTHEVVCSHVRFPVFSPTYPSSLMFSASCFFVVIVVVVLWQIPPRADPVEMEEE